MAPRSYREFWPHYVRAHSRPATQRAHVVATLLGTGCAAAGLASGELLLVPLAVVVAYAVAVPSHFIFEHNRPTLGRYPLWSAFADVQLCWFFAAGRMQDEVKRALGEGGEPESS
jgi:hypothetical protein